MIDSLIDSSDVAIPIHAVDPDGLEKLLDSLGETEAAWARSTGFDAAAGAVTIIADAKGVIGRVLFGLGRANGRRAALITGKLPAILPQGDYQFVTDLPDRGPVAPCDRRLIGQAVTNLLQNAAEAVAMREGGHEIVISLRVTSDQIAISVQDDGIGLPAQDRDRLSEPYVTHKPKGTGLGLAIVKKIMEDHGGRIVLEDRPQEGERSPPGAIARLILPLRAAETASA